MIVRTICVICWLASCAGFCGLIHAQLQHPIARDVNVDLVWTNQYRTIEFLSPRLTVAQSGESLGATCRSCVIGGNSATIVYEIASVRPGTDVAGTFQTHFQLDSDGDTLRLKESLKLHGECRVDLRVCRPSRAIGNPGVAVVSEDTEFRPLDFYSGTAAIYTRGAAAHSLKETRPVSMVYDFVAGSTDKSGIQLSMPVGAIVFSESDAPAACLSCAMDPFYGTQLTVNVIDIITDIDRETIYRGTVVPFSRQQRTSVMRWTPPDPDKIFRTFYRTVPDLEPGRPWVRNVAMGYYDYNSDGGEGWYHDLDVLAKRIPPEHRGKVACCLHGWYDWTGSYTYDHERNRLLSEWTAFDNGIAGREPIAMSKQKVHDKIQFAKSLGFRVVLYLADCTNMTASRVHESWCDGNLTDYRYTNAKGQQPAGWTGPCGGGLQLDITHAAVRRWFQDYFRTLLDEYGTEVDGFVLDETNYFSAGAISRHPDRPAAYADLAQMQFIYDLSLLVQQYRDHNPDLCLFDGSHYLYGLVTHGSFTDFEGIPLVVNYRNSAIQCCWEDPGVRNVHCRYRTDPNLVYPYGLDVGLSNGWGSDLGPSEFTEQRLDEVIEHFLKRATQGPPSRKIDHIDKLNRCLREATKSNH
jgi:hypothetical protein